VSGERAAGDAVSFDGREPVAAALAKARAAVACGVGEIWLACHLFERDPLVTAAVLLERHPGLRVTLVAISPYVLHPVQAAMTAATLDELFPGRVALCLGAGAPVDLAAAGVEAPAPLATLGEALALCRALLAGDTVRFEGRRFRVAGRALGAGRREVPLLLAASGPRMLRLAGAHADGVLLSAGASVEYVRWSLEQVAAGGPPAHFRRCALIYASVADDAGYARDRVRPVLASTLRGAHHARNLALAGSRLDQAALRAAFAAGGSAAAGALIDDDIVSRHAVAGGPGELRSRLAAYRRAGLDESVLASMRTPEEVEAVVGALRPSP
jgi:5,10-methylenetetrahydromethanopterin reductase